jgi:hypothetical protein
MGVIPRCLQYILNSPLMAYSEIHVSYLQIYCEIICDLLVPSNTQLTIRERSGGGGGLYVEGLSRSQVGSLEDLTRVMNQVHSSSGSSSSGSGSRSSASTC